MEEKNITLTEETYSRAKLIEELNEIKEEQDYNHVNIDYRLINRAPEDSILEEAKEYNPSLVVMGHKGKGETEDVILGSVTS